MQSLRNTLWRQQAISHTTKLRIYNAAFLAILLLYRPEMWPHTTNLSSRLYGFDIKGCQINAQCPLVRIYLWRNNTWCLMTQQYVSSSIKVPSCALSSSSSSLLRTRPLCAAAAPPWHGPRVSFCRVRLETASRCFAHSWIDVFSNDFHQLDINQDQAPFPGTANPADSMHDASRGTAHEIRWWRVTSLAHLRVTTAHLITHNSRTVCSGEKSHVRKFWNIEETEITTNEFYCNKYYF